MSNSQAHTYLALLRGINVGGNNIIKMADLQECFTKDLVFTDVKTYIQSGNVIFASPSKDKAKLLTKIEQGLTKRYGKQIPVVILTASELEEVVAKAPPGFGAQKEEYKYDVIYLKSPLTTKKAIAAIETREGVDNVYPGPNVVYFSRLVKELTKSKLGKIVVSPIYPNITIRNWNTTTKLWGMMEEK